MIKRLRVTVDGNTYDVTVEMADEQVAQYVTKIEQVIGTSINQAAFAQVTGANQ